MRQHLPVNGKDAEAADKDVEVTDAQWIQGVG